MNAFTPGYLKILINYIQKLNGLVPRKSKFDLRTAIDQRGEKTINKNRECRSAIAKWYNNRSEQARNTKKLYNNTGFFVKIGS